MNAQEQAHQQTTYADHVSFHKKGIDSSLLNIGNYRNINTNHIKYNGDKNSFIYFNK
jgi:hypothetical protein